MIFKFKIYIIVLTLGFLFSGCSFKQLKNDYTLEKNSKKTIFVMGINSKQYKLLMWPGNIQDKYFIIEDTWKNAAHYDTAKSGYIVGIVDGNDHVGFKSIELMSQDNTEIILNQKFCQGMKTPVFEVPSGKVVYAGDIILKQNKGYIEYSLDSNFEKAKKFINEKYPNLKDKLEKTNITQLYSTKPCREVQQMYIPLYIPM